VATLGGVTGKTTPWVFNTGPGTFPGPYLGYSGPLFHRLPRGGRSLSPSGPVRKHRSGGILHEEHVRTETWCLRRWRLSRAPLLSSPGGGFRRRGPGGFFPSAPPRTHARGTTFAPGCRWRVPPVLVTGAPGPYRAPSLLQPPAHGALWRCAGAIHAKPFLYGQPPLPPRGIRAAGRESIFWNTGALLLLQSAHPGRAGYPSRVPFFAGSKQFEPPGNHRFSDSGPGRPSLLSVVPGPFFLQTNFPAAGTASCSSRSRCGGLKPAAGDF
jgi:hypothetical protein